MKIHLIQKIEELEGFMSSNVGKGKPEEEKKTIHKCYSTLEELLKSLKETKYSFYLNKRQWILDELISVS
jgi:predicted DNA-binding protein (MmcQ/YjbR family)